MAAPIHIVPSIRRLGTLREFVHQVQRSTGEVGRQSKRDATWFRTRNDSELLGWIAETDDGWALTDAGAALLDTAPDSDAERACFRRAIEHHPITKLLPELLSETTLTPEDVQRALEHAGLEPSTAKNRRTVLMRWREQALVRQLPLVTALWPTGRVQTDLRDQNPWWRGLPDRPAQHTVRSFIRALARTMDQQRHPIVAIRGPRQVGKSTGIRQRIAEMLNAGFPPERILRVQFDDLSSWSQSPEPILDIADWFQRTIAGGTFNQLAQTGPACWLFFDEVQKVKDWPNQVKHLIDVHEVRVVITGSSSLAIKTAQDSLAGRIHTIEVATLSVREIAMFHGLPVGAEALNGAGSKRLGEKEFWMKARDQGIALRPARDDAFRRFSAIGGYPGLHKPGTDEDEALASLASLVDRVVGTDLPREAPTKDARVLREFFRAVMRSAGRNTSIEKLRQSLSPEHAAGYSHPALGRLLYVLRDALLVREVEPAEGAKALRSAGSKFCLADHGLRMVELGLTTPLTPQELREAQETVRKDAGYVAESVLGAWLFSLGGLEIRWLPAHGSQPEVDFVIRVQGRQVPIEVKYQSKVDARDADGLRAFVQNPRHNASFGVLVTLDDDGPDDDPRIIRVPLSSLLFAV